MVGRSVCNKNKNLFDENMYYFSNDIQKTFRMRILKYAERTRKVFEMAKILYPPIRKNEKCHESVWDTRYISYNEDIVCKKIKDDLPSEIQEEVE